MILHGRNLMIMQPFTVQGTVSYQAVVAEAKSCEIDVACDAIEISSPTSGQWREFLAGRKEWSVSLSHLVPAGTIPTDVSMIGTTVTLVLYERDSGLQLSGSALVVAWRTVATVGNLCTGTFTFKGSGELS